MEQTLLRIKIWAAGVLAFGKSRAWFWPLSGALLLAVVLLAFFRDSQRGQWVQARKGPIVEAIYSLGTIKAEHTWSMKTGIAAGITAIYVKEGDAVETGQKLLSTDSTTFHAPFKGTVTHIAVQKGEVLMPGVPALHLMDLDLRYIQLSLDQPSALRIREGQTAEISLESIRGEKLIGTVEHIYPFESQFLVRVNVARMPPEILPDMTADVAIEVSRHDDSLLVPLAAVQRGQITMRRSGERKRTLQVQIGAVNEEFAEILDGSIQPGDEVFLPAR